MLIQEKKIFKNPNVMTFEERQNDIKRNEEIEKNRLIREKNSPYKRWAQYNLEHTPRMMELALTNSKAYAILLFLVDQMDEYNAVICSQQTIQELLEISKATVIRGVNTLKNGGFLTVLKSGKSNIYTINDTVYWKSWGKNKRYSKFPANVVITESEQEENTQITFADFDEDNEEYKSLSERYNKITNKKYKHVVKD
jgi:Trp operon repressor